jgi:hypothetical protein
MRLHCCVLLLSVPSNAVPVCNEMGDIYAGKAYKLSLESNAVELCAAACHS